jgi:hypothetical protein
VVNSSVFITVVLAVMAGNVAMMGLVVKGLSERIGDVVARMDRTETKLDGIAETLARFDERLKHLEDAG